MVLIIARKKGELGRGLDGKIGVVGKREENKRERS
jgi:hypothetical protein